MTPGDRMTGPDDTVPLEFDVTRTPAGVEPFPSDAVTQQERARSVKLSCRNLWKVYGNRAYALDRDREVFGVGCNAARERLKRVAQFPAVLNASFDVHVGEIFVIMGLSGSG